MATNAIKSGQVTLGGMIVNRLGFGAMRITGEGIWGEPANHQEAITVLRRAVNLVLISLIRLIPTGRGIGKAH
jgi:pyridoxine 4-dehydrogenase